MGGVRLVVVDSLMSARLREDVIILCSCRCPHRSVPWVHVNFQQEKCYSQTCNFYLCMNEKCYSFKGQSWKVKPWEGTILCVSGYNQLSFTKVGNQQIKPRQESTKVGANEIDLIWSQSCYSVLHSHNKYQRKIPTCFLHEYGESNHFEIYQNTVFFSF